MGRRALASFLFATTFGLGAIALTVSGCLSGPPATQVVGVGLPELAAPLVDGVVGDAHTTFGHHLLDVTQAQRKPVIQPHTVANDLHREPVTSVQRRHGIHAPMLVHTRHTATEHPSPAT